MLPRKVVSLNVLPYLAMLFNFVQSDNDSIALQRQLLFHHEPPFENHYYRKDNNVTEHFIKQRVDNFDHQNKETFQMRYLQNAEHFKSGGPIFIYIGGEWRISPGSISSGKYIYDLAEEFGGLLIYTEHRYYGKTWPTKTVSTENLKYLSIEQSLADLAHLIVAITSDKQLNATGGVIIVGCSYSATMAAWFRQKYPHLVEGAWASSGPLNAKLNYFEYIEIVGKSIREIGGPECYDKIERSFQLIEDLLKAGDFETLQKFFMICDNGFNTSNKYDVWFFITSLIDMFSSIVQRHSAGMIEYYCKVLSEECTNETDDIKNHELYSFTQVYENFFKPNANSCISMDYNSEIKKLSKDNTTLAFNFRPWLYQTCSEFGWYQTTDSENHPFGKSSPLEYHLNLCKDIFGNVFQNPADIEDKVQHTNVLYGGFQPDVTNVYFTHGSIDPWHHMGVLEDLNLHSPATIVPGISHCKDLGSIHYGKDPKPLINSKVTIRNLVKKWLKY